MTATPVQRTIPSAHLPLALYREDRGPREAPPVLFVHGICASTSYWTCRLGALEEQFRCTTMDLLGHGRSPKPSQAGYTLSEQADLVAPILLDVAKQSGRPVPVVAHSMGNFVTLELRRRYPELVGPIYGMGMPYFPSREVAYQTFMQLNPFAALPVYRPWWAPPLLNAARYSKGKIGYTWFNKNYGLPRDCWEDGFAVTWASLSGSLHNLILSTNVDELLASAGTHDIEWWHGTHDQSAPAQYVKELWQRHPHVPTTLVDKGNHNVWIQHNERLIGMLQERLQQYYGR